MNLVKRNAPTLGFRGTKILQYDVFERMYGVCSTANTGHREVDSDLPLADPLLPFTPEVTCGG
jgi:hypothetical protein